MTRAVASREAFGVWEAQRRELEAHLAPIEARAHAILQSLHCPTDPAAIYAILKGEARRPWPAKTAPRDQQQALHAMHVLVAIRDTRASLGLLDGNAPRAALAALRAGFLANAIDAALGAKVR